MKIIHNDISSTEDREGSITFKFNGYVYQIGTIDHDDEGWFSRQTVEDYENERDNHETPTGWGPENVVAFRFLKDPYQ